MKINSIFHLEILILLLNEHFIHSSHIIFEYYITAQCSALNTLRAY